MVLTAVTVLIFQSGCAWDRKEIKLPTISFERRSNKVIISIGGNPFAHYVFKDRKTTRPYFSHVKTPSGIQATRIHPPIEGIDAIDHDTFHPGIWLGLGDISGHYFDFANKQLF